MICKVFTFLFMLIYVWKNIFNLYISPYLSAATDWPASLLDPFLTGPLLMLGQKSVVHQLLTFSRPGGQKLQILLHLKEPATIWHINFAIPSFLWEASKR